MWSVDANHGNGNSYISVLIVNPAGFNDHNAESSWLF